VRLQIASRLAIFALLELAASPGRQVSVAEIGEKYGVSSHHLAKVMNALGRAGLVRAVRGAGGGYHFSGNARRITLLDVISLFENLESGNVEVGATGQATDEARATGQATDEARALGGVLAEIDDAVRATLGSITIATLLRIVERGRGGRTSAAPADQRREDPPPE